MIHFLKDFTYFCETKKICKMCYKLGFCANCKSQFLCQKCRNCKNCNQQQLLDINLNEIIEEQSNIILSILNFEGNKKIQFKIKYEIHESHVKAHPDLLKSIIFNIIYYIFKNIDEGKIEIVVAYLNDLNEDKFSSNNYSEVEEKINSKSEKSIILYNEIHGKIKGLSQIIIKNKEKIGIFFKTNSHCYENESRRFIKSQEIINNIDIDEDIEAIGFDEFNKCFQIYVSMFLSRKMQSDIILKKNTHGCEYFLE